MTFEQFQATRQWCEDLPAAVSSDNWGDDPQGTPKGNLYLGCLYIEHVQDWWPQDAKDRGDWYLLLGRDEWITNDLTALERRLYDWAASEGYFS
jgi:hypothetical protein